MPRQQSAAGDKLVLIVIQFLEYGVREQHEKNQDRDAGARGPMRLIRPSGAFGVYINH